MTIAETAPLVTVGIPTYNRVQGLERTLTCMLKQTYKNLEIIISDNCSPDPAVRSLLERLSLTDNRIKYYMQEKNLSIIPNFKFLLDKANGQFFMWAADDDDWDNNFIEVCLNGIKDQNNAVACIADVKIVNLNGIVDTKIITSGFMHSNLYQRLFQWVRANGETRYFFCGLFRTDKAKSCSLPNNWGGDQMFLLELITKGKFLYIPGLSVFYYYRGGSSTNFERIKKAFNIKSRYYYPESYVFQYAWYHFRFKHLNAFQKLGLFFVNSAGLILNKEFILYYAAIKKPFMNLKNFVQKKLSGGKKHSITYNQDGITTVHNAGFMLEDDFKKAEHAGAATGSWANIHWRLHTVLWAAHHCKNIEGDFVECGTNKGGFARAIIEYVDFISINKIFYLLDTFEGLVENLLTDAEKSVGKKQHFEGVYEDCYEQVKKTFSYFGNVKIVKGPVPDTLSEVKSDKIAFLSVDMNSLKPEVAALDYFWEKISKGGMIVLDDYAYVTCDLQYKAHNDWAEQKGIKILSLPTGQGLIVK
ncbi:MAG TPA: glycosyltransferase [Chitinophagaceae bacterium]|nr:glycosyltransferase [Chitinophagaceae bacterium]